MRPASIAPERPRALRRFHSPRDLTRRIAAVKTILVVEDEPAIATLARDYLEHAGFSHDSVQSLTGQASSPSHAGKSPVVRVYRQQSPTASVPTQP